MRRAPALVMALAFSIALSGVARAQTSRLHLGPHFTYNFDVEKFGLGVQFSAPVARRLEFYPSFDLYFVDPGSRWGLNADLKYRFATEGWDWLYVGGGLNLANRSNAGTSNTDAGLNMIGGVESLRGMIHPFGELRVTVGSGSTAQLTFGLNFTLGRHL